MSTLIDELTDARMTAEQAGHVHEAARLARRIKHLQTLRDWWVILERSMPAEARRSQLAQSMIEQELP